MKILALLLLFFPLVASAEDLNPVEKPELATVLGLLDELATTARISQQPYIVRVYAVPIGILECGGSVASCPDVRLFVTVSHGDLGETPTLYQLPTQKGWEFRGWSNPVTIGGTSMVTFTVRSALPETNIDRAAREGWHSEEYRVFVSPESASYVRH